MHPDLERLIRLQEIEIQIKHYSERIELLPKKMSELESKLSGTQQSLTASQERLTHLSSDRRKLEGAIQDLELKNSKYRGQLTDVRTNEQYRSLLSEIDFNSQQIRKIEDDILVNMEQEEKLRQEIVQIEQRLAKERANVEAEKRTAQTEVEQHKSLLAQLQQDRQSLIQSIDPTLFETYVRIATARRGLALARANGDSCQACNVRIRPHLLTQVMSGAIIVTCDSCDRILYWQPDAPYETPA